MNERDSSAEAVLCEGYASQAALYGRALAVAEDLLQEPTGGKQVQEKLYVVRGILGEVARVEEGMAAAKNRWASLGRQPGPQLRSVLERVASLIEQVTRHVREAERAMRCQRDAMTPQIDLAVRGRQMLRAYGESATQGEL